MTTREEITERLADILEECAGVKPDEVSEDKRFEEDLDIDSLAMVEIEVAVEEVFEISVPQGAFNQFATVGAAVDYIEKAQAAKAGA